MNWIDDPSQRLCLTGLAQIITRIEPAVPQAITVLVVEDEALIRMDIADQLKDLGFKVLEATDASQAVTLLSASDEIQVMFTDVDMPGDMDA